MKIKVEVVERELDQILFDYFARRYPNYKKIRTELKGEVSINERCEIEIANYWLDAEIDVDDKPGLKLIKGGKEDEN